MRALILATLLLTACVPPTPVTPTPDADAATTPTPPPALEASPAPMGACDYTLQHLRAIGCEPRHPEDGTWVDACMLDRANGLSFNLMALNTAATIADVKRAGVSCQSK